MEPGPLMAAEVQRIEMAFRAASAELSAALAVIHDANLAGVGVPTGDAAVSAGLADLRASLERLQGTADDCVAATRRQLGGAADTGASTPGER